MVFFTSLLFVLSTFGTASGACDTSGKNDCSTFVTFNSGLTPRIGHYADRTSSIPADLLQEDADVVCLQEFWFEKDVEKLVSEVQDKYPYHFSPLHKSVGVLADPKDPGMAAKSACSASDVTYFYGNVLPCAQTEGCVAELAKSTDQGLGCLTQKCSHVLQNSAFNADCFSCVTMSASGMSDLLAWCLSQGTGPDNRFNAPGLVLLSKRPILKEAYHSYDPSHRTTLRRGYIQAEVENMGQVVCTHLTAAFGTYYEYNLPYSSYAEQQRHEVETVQNKFGAVSHILAGDFNMATKEESKDGENNVTSIFLDKGYKTSYMTDDGRCTYCSKDNEFSVGQNRAIDFILFKGNFDYSYRCAERVLDRTSPYPLSDHFGVKTTMCK